MLLAINAHEQQRPDHRPCHHQVRSCRKHPLHCPGEAEPVARSAAGRAPFSRPVADPPQHLGSHDDEQGQQGQHIAHELDHEGAGQREIRHRPAQHHQFLAARAPELTDHRPPQAGERGDAERPAQSPPHLLRNLVEEWRGTNVLPGVGPIRRAAYHRALLSDLLEVPAQVQDRKGRGDGKGHARRQQPEQDPRSRSLDDDQDRALPLGIDEDIVATVHRADQLRDDQHGE